MQVYLYEKGKSTYEKEKLNNKIFNIVCVIFTGNGNLLTNISHRFSDKSLQLN